MGQDRLGVRRPPGWELQEGSVALGCQGPALRSGGRVGATLGGAWRGEASQGAGRTESADSSAGGSPAL